jgi:hypothetical protein
MKELGFDEICVCYYDGNNLFIVDRNSKIESKNSVYSSNELFNGVISTPTFSQAFRWFRDKYNIFPEILTDCTTEPKFCYTYTRFFGNSKDLASEEWGWENNIGQYSLLYRTYEEAELECLKNLCDILEQQLKELKQ